MVYWNCDMVSCLCLMIVRMRWTSSRSFCFAGCQLPVGDSQPPRYLRGECGGVTVDGVMEMVPSGLRTGMATEA